MIRILLPVHLRRLAGVEGEIQVDLPDRPTLGDALDAIENAYSVLRGTIREHQTLKRRPFVRYFACEQDLSHHPSDTPLPEPIVQGKEPLLIIGAMAGG